MKNEANIDYIVQGKRVITQVTLTCLKSTIETLEKGVKYVQS